MKKEEKKRDRKQIILPILYLVVFTVIVVLLQKFVCSPYMVEGDSMTPSLVDKDILLVNKQVYKSEKAKRFDLVVFQYKYDHKVDYVKRVIALPGEKIEIKNNAIYINDKELKEYYGIYEEEKVIDDYPAYILRSDEYFVLGDNRQHSVDSRSGDVGLVTKDMIVGRADFRIFPFSAFGSLKDQ